MSDTVVAGAKARPESELIDVEAARQGDRQAFARLVERYQTPVCSLAYALTGSFVQSEEVAQEAFITAWTRMRDMRDPTRFRAWLYGITQNVCRNARRKLRAQSTVHASLGRDVDVPSGGPTPLDAAISQEEEGLLWRALAEIPEVYRVPLVLFYREQEGIESVAEALGLTETTVKQRLWRGRKLLQQQIEAFLASALRKTRPGRRFTAAVVAAIAAGRIGSPDARAAGAFKRLQQAFVSKPMLLAAVAVLPLVAIPIVKRATAPPPPQARAEPAAIRNVPAWRALAAPPLPMRPLVTGSAPANGPAPERLFFLDFEDGVLPSVTRFGQVVPGPPRPDNQHALLGTVVIGHTVAELAVDVESSLPRYRRTQVLSFDYWAGSDTKRVLVQIYDVQKKLNYLRALEPDKIVREQWAHAALRLSAFTPFGVLKVEGPRRSMDDGDTMILMTILGGRVGGKPFYVDNIEIADYPLAALREISEGVEVIR